MYSACDKIINVGVNTVIETTNKMFHQFVQYLQSYSGFHSGSIVYRAASISVDWNKVSHVVRNVFSNYTFL